jgi:beta-mannosidase
VVSWSGIDYYGRWKALHYSSRRFFDPVLLSIEDVDTHMGVFVTNDTREALSFDVRWSLETLQGERLDSGEEQVSVDALSTVRVKHLDFSERITDANRRGTVVVCDLLRDDHHIQTALATFAPTKHLTLEDPHLTTELSTEGPLLAIRVHADSLARFVELAFEGMDVLFSDNYFDLPAGRTVQVTCPLPEGWTLAQARAALRICSVFDTY